MENLSVRPELCESQPSKFEWTLAFVFFLFAFMSFCYWDVGNFILYEIKFAGAILHFNLKEAYEPVVTIMNSSGDLRTSLSIYDLTINLIFGLWGIPLYLWCSRSGELVINFPESFWQILYGKSVLLVAFLISAVLVYKVCRALDLDEKKSSWGAYLYFTSIMSTLIIGVVGQCDIFAVCVTLTALMYYFRCEYKKSIIWFILACQFKQFAFFMFVPMLLLRYKKMYKVISILALTLIVTFLFNLPIMFINSVSTARSKFQLENLQGLMNNMLPIFRGNMPLLVLLLGVLCIYSLLNGYYEGISKREMNNYGIFTAMTSMIILFTNFNSASYWFIHMIPYLAIMTMYNSKYSDKVLFFEVVGIASLAAVCYIDWSHHYVPNNSNNMLLHKLLGSPDILKIRQLVQDTLTAGEARTAVFVGAGFKRLILFMDNFLEIVYVLCMYTIIYLSLPAKLVLSDSLGKCSRSDFIKRFWFNTAVSYVPILLVIIAACGGINLR